MPTPRVDLTEGDEYSSWTVISPDRDSKNRVLCRCECGDPYPVNIYALRSGHSRGCRNCYVANPRGRGRGTRRDATWVSREDKYGDWEVLKTTRGSNSMAPVRCGMCQNLYEVRVAALIEGKSERCKSCSTVVKQTRFWVVLDGRRIPLKWLLKQEGTIEIHATGVSIKKQDGDDVPSLLDPGVPGVDTPQAIVARVRDRQ